MFFHILCVDNSYYDMGIGRFVEWTTIKMLAWYAWVSLDLFFILSGFILTYKYYDIFIDKFSFKTIGIFILKRFIRIYPLYFTALLLCILLYIFGILNNKIGNTDTLIVQFALIQTLWGIPEYYRDTWNIPGWSLSAEWIAYFFLIPTIYILKNNMKIVILGMIGIFIYIFLYEIKHLDRVCIGLLTGFFLAHIYTHKNMLKPKINKYSDRIVYIAISSLGLTYLYGFEPILKIILPYSYLVILVTIFFLPKCTGVMKFVFGNRIALFLGEISYPIYIFQYPIFIFLDQYKYKFYTFLIVDEQFSQNRLWIFVFLVVLIIIIFATIMHYLIEKPVMDFFKKRLILKKAEK